MERRVASSSASIVMGALFGALIAAGVWSASYGISAGQTLVGLALSHVAIGGLLGIGLAFRGHANGHAGFVCSTGFLITGAAGLGAAAPWVAEYSSLGRFAILGTVAILLGAALIEWVRTPWGQLSLGLATLICIAGFALFPVPMISPQAMKLSTLRVESDAPLSRVALVGIDGGDWRVIDPMIRAGELPTIAGLVQRGARGVLRSIDPTYSPVVWTSMFSGMSPAQHGIHDWYSATAENRKVPLLWEIVAAAGESAISLNVPGSWPPLPFSGAIVAGFPMPRLIVSESLDSGQFLGKVVGASKRESIVPSVVWSGSSGQVPLGREQIVARTLVRHPVIEEAILRHWLTGATDSIALEIDGSFSDEGPLQLEAQGKAFSLRRGEWTPWLDVEVGGNPAFLRIRRLESGELYLTPPFQSPQTPRFNFVAGDVSAEEFAPTGRYVVEGVGWKAVADAGLRPAVAEHLAHVSSLQVLAARELAQRPWTLFTFVFTLTDRISHGYWGGSTHADPTFAATPESSDDPGDAVREAYRVVDRDLGLLIDEFGTDVTVFILSDHGFRSDPAHGGGTHRKEGIFIASGPGILPSKEMLDLSIYDVTPTVLAGLGLPVTEEMSSSPFLDLFEFAPSPKFVKSYSSGAPGPATDRPSNRIDESTEEQLRSLGYIE